MKTACTTDPQVEKQVGSCSQHLKWGSGVIFVLVVCLLGTQAFLFHKRSVQEPFSQSTVDDIDDTLSAPAADLMTDLSPNTKFTCVYNYLQNSSEGAYSPNILPFPLCHNLVFCCLQPMVLPTQSQVAAIKTLKNLGEQRSLYVVFGGTQDSDIVLARLLNDAWQQSLFAHYVFDVRRRFAFDGIYLYWAEPEEKHRMHMVMLADQLRQKLSTHLLGLGFMVNGRQEFTGALDLVGLLRRLGPRRVFIAPPFYPPMLYSKTEIYHHHRLLSIHSKLANMSGKYSGYLCHGVSIAGVAFALKTSGQLPVEGEIAKGPGALGTRMGVVSYADICRLKFDDLSTRSFATVGVSGRTWVTYLDPVQARRFFTYVSVLGRTNCLGFWNPEFDDIAGKCGFSKFPIMRSTVTNRF
ncbi:uncharacterized protein LOC135396012 [Ornithodoros turicata]|uniref:uncharacterized protein LOC135396012 n=1 Tax=Ornithodoros turicata TaxID=34597 RepID=UPI0031388D9A